MQCRGPGEFQAAAEMRLSPSWPDARPVPGTGAAGLRASQMEWVSLTATWYKSTRCRQSCVTPWLLAAIDAAVGHKHCLPVRLELDGSRVAYANERL
jgi:hypothetical protein